MDAGRASRKRSRSHAPVSSNWVKFPSCRRNSSRSENSSGNILANFFALHLKRVLYFWVGPPQADIVAGYDLMIARHLMFILPAAFAFAGLWLTLRNRKRGGFLLTCFLLIYPLPYYLVNPFPRYKHAIEPEMILLAVYLFWEASRVQINWPRARPS